MSGDDPQTQGMEERSFCKACPPNPQQIHAKNLINMQTPHCRLPELELPNRAQDVNFIKYCRDFNMC